MQQTASQYFFQRSIRLLALAMFALVLIANTTACGSSDELAESDNGSSDELAESDNGSVDEKGVRLTTRAESFYSISDLEAVGFKKSKQFTPQTVPGSTDIWYGFFSQRDIEVRFYTSHADALGMGAEAAEVIIARTAGQRDYLIPVVNLYPAYAVVGNTVMLCERLLSTCEALIDALPE
jgi:hypothetical protein